MKQEILDCLAASQTPKLFRAGEILFSQGDPANEFYYLISGLSLTYVIYEDGRERNMLMTWPGRVFGASTFFEGVPRRVSAIAIKPCSVYVIDREAYAELCRRFPDFNTELLYEISRDLGVMFDELADYSMTSAEQRVARFLCRRLAGGQHGGTPEVPELMFTQDFIANVLGISRISVSKAVSSLTNRGWLETAYGAIRITNTAALREYAYG